MTPGAAGPSSLVGRRVAVEVPASIANLGAGFDCLGLAIDLALRVEVAAVEAKGGATTVVVSGEGVAEIPAGRENRFVEALEAGLRARGIEVGTEIGWRVEMTNQIPLARGLGSSAAAVVAGLLAAATLAAPAGEATDPHELLAAASGMEGHPDNVAPALLGGLVASFARGGEDGALPTSYAFEVPETLRVVLLIPERRIATSEMRAILPLTVPRRDAVGTLGRATAAIAGIASGDWTALRLLNGDRLHEPYRSAVYPELPGLIHAALGAGALLACLAGAGSSVAAFTLDGQEDATRLATALGEAAREAGLPAHSTIVRARNIGARLVQAA